MLLLPSALHAQRLSESTGVNLFKIHCMKCHGITPVEHAPSEATIKQMTPERIYAAITIGSMKDNAAALSDADKRLLAEYMGGRKLDREDAGDLKNMPNACASHPLVKDINAPSWNGWGDLSNTRFQSANAAGLSKPQKMLRNDGTIVTQVVESVRPPGRITAPCGKTPGQYSNVTSNWADYVQRWINARF